MPRPILANVVFALSLAGALSAQVPDLYDPETVRDLRLTFSQPDWWNQLLANYSSHTDIAADLGIDNVTLTGVGVRFRGATSYLLLPPSAEKRSINIETKWTVPGQELWGYDSLNLNNGFHDPTFLREFLAYLVMGRHGPAPRCNFVRLWLNGVYWGIYVNVQQPDRKLMQQSFGSSGGSRYRAVPPVGSFDNGRCAMTWLGTSPLAYLQAYDRKQGDGMDLMQLCNVLNNTPLAQLRTALPPVFSVDTFYRYAAVMNVITNTDSYLGTGKEHFLFRDERHGDFHVLPFDMNAALFGSATLDPWAFTTDPARPALSRTLSDPEWRQRYVAHCRNVVATTFNTTWLSPMIAHYHALIAADVAADTRKLYTTAQFQQNLNGPVTIDDGYGPVVLPGLLPLVAARTAFLQAHPDLAAPAAVLSALRHQPGAPAPGQPLAVAVTTSPPAASALLWYRTGGTFANVPMADDGLHGDGGAGDGVYGAILPGMAAGALLEYYVEAFTGSGVVTLLPANAEGSPVRVQVGWPITPSAVLINEFVAQNQHGAQDEQGQHEDWIELYNASSQVVDAGGLWLSDTLAQPKWQIPAGTTIAGNGVLRIWCDEDLNQGPLHANFKLAAAGEAVVLFARDGRAMLDAFVFGQQTVDVSTGRLRDGGLPWVTFPVPTYLQRNELSSCGSRAYGALVAGTHGASLATSGRPAVGGSVTLGLVNGPGGGTAVFGLAPQPAHQDLTPFGVPREVLLLDPASLLPAAVLPLAANGAASWPLAIPNRPALAGFRFYAQAFTLAPSAVDSSNGLEIVICP